MVICEDCGDVLDESDLKQERSYISDYMGGCYGEPFERRKDDEAN